MDAGLRPVRPPNPGLGIGVPDFEISEWQGAVVATGTPNAVINRLHQEFVKTLALPEVRERIAGVGSRAVGSTPEELATHLNRERAKWSKVIKAAAIRIE